MLSQLIYHITQKQAWLDARKQGFYQAPSLVTEGFIHCSQEDQVAGVLKRYFPDKTSLLKLVIDPTRVTSKLIFETPRSGNGEFPHIYGPLNLDAVVSVVVVPETESTDSQSIQQL